MLTNDEININHYKRVKNTIQINMMPDSFIKFVIFQVFS